MQKTRCYIVDDEVKARDTLRKVLTTFFTSVEVVGDSGQIDKAFEEINQTQPHLVFLDIEMGTESGFQLLEKFDQIPFHVAFVTAHEEFALKAIKFSALDYIIKPASISDLKTLLQKVEDNPIGQRDNPKVRHLFTNFLLGDKSEHKITLATQEGFEFVKVGQILYLRADGSYTNIYLKDGQTLTSSKNLKFFESILEGYGFFRIHNSTLVNLKFIKRLGKSAGGFVVMEDEAEFSISKSRKEEFIALLSLS